MTFALLTPKASFSEVMPQDIEVSVGVFPQRS